MLKFLLRGLFFLFFSFNLFGQNTKDTITNLQEIVIKSQRIDLPFSKNSHTIYVLKAKEIAAMPVKSLEELLQNIQGLDVRRRGVVGTQADLYIRGGNFNQSLLLIDGIPMNDLQTGHHTMNAMIALENIERIEIIKGAASRIYGENAMNGAINIITKNPIENNTKISVQFASFETYGVNISSQQVKDSVGILFQINRLQSQGYRFNTDFENMNSFFKVKWKNYELITSYGQRKFGANGFYASPDYKDQYEETQTHLFALKNTFADDSKRINTNLYWRRNQDMYLFIRNNPLAYRNLHVNNRVGASVNATFINSIGHTGVGLDLNQGFLVSNNLGNHNRFTSTLFFEHRFQFINNQLDIKPGIAITHYSDLGFYYYPGIDVGYRLSNAFKLYTNIGHTYRNPTYTNLYYHSASEIGNKNLIPEKALSIETGLHFNKGKFNANLTGFHREAKDFIDYVKNDFNAKWEANNVGTIVTSGVETTFDYSFKIVNYDQQINLGYSFIDQLYNNTDYTFSRYGLNAYKHQFSIRLSTKFISYLEQNISYRYHERYENEPYHLLDFGINATKGKWKLGVNAYNIFNTEYYETNLVPMPKANYGLNLQYSL